MSVYLYVCECAYRSFDSKLVICSYEEDCLNGRKSSIKISLPDSQALFQIV